MTYLEPWLSHLDAQVLGLVAAGDAGAVVGTEDNDRPADKAWLKHTLAAHVEVVAVDERVHDDRSGKPLDDRRHDAPYLQRQFGRYLDGSNAGISKKLDL